MEIDQETATRVLNCGYLLLPFIIWACSPDYGDLITSQDDLPPAIFAFLFLIISLINSRAVAELHKAVEKLFGLSSPAGTWRFCRANVTQHLF
jgi:hypothetical protein